MSAALNADAFGVGVPKGKGARKTKVEKAIVAMDITESTARVQEVVEQVGAIPDVLSIHVGTGRKHAPVVETKKATSKAVAHTPRTLASKRGSDLVRYLRIHTKHPYGRRGEQAIVDIAREAAHLGNLELDAVSA